MNAVLINKEHLSYTSKKSGKPVDGWAIAYLKKKRNATDTFKGYDVGNDFISNTPENNKLLENLAKVQPGDHLELIYECDGKYNFLDAVVPHEKVFDFTKSI